MFSGRGLGRYVTLDADARLARKADLGLVRRSRTGVLFYPAAALLVALMVALVPREQVFVGAAVVVGAARLALLRRFTRRYTRAPRRVMLAYKGFILTAAVIWSSLFTSLLARHGPDTPSLIAALFTLALVSVALTVYVMDLRLFDVYLALLVGPPIAVLVPRGDAASLALAGGGVGFAAYCFLAAARQHAEQWGRLRSAALLAERALDLERRVSERTAELEVANARLESEMAELARVQTGLREREEEYRRIFEGAHDAVLIFEPTSEVVLNVNERACQIYGFPRDEFIGMSLRSISRWVERGEQQVQRTLESGCYNNFETIQRRKDGSELMIEVNASVVQYRGQAAILSINRDLTERRRLEDLRLEKEAAERSAQAKSEFLATVSHEIRTPMNGVLGLTGALLESELSPAQREMAESIRSSGEHLLAIINDILDFSRIDSGRLELEEQPFDLRNEIEECLDVVASAAIAKPLDLAYEIEEGTPEALVGDASRVRHVLINLLGNAVKFTERGEVVLSAGAREDAGRVEVRLAVRDTGIGIASDRVGRLFQPFSQADMSMARRYGGTGLGLVISKRLAELMGGRVSVESQPGLGSTFTFTFRARHGRPEVSAPSGLRGHALLIADDHEPGRRTLAALARAWGLRVGSAGTAAEALVQAGLAPPDVVLVDDELAAGGSTRLLVALREVAPGVRVIRMAHPAAARTAAGASGPGEELFVWRPVRAAALRRAFELALGVGEPAARSGPASAAVEAPAVPLRVLLAEDNVVNQKVGLLMLRRLGYAADVVGDGLEVLDALAAREYDVVLMDVQMPELDGLEATRRLRAELPPQRQPYIIALTANAMPDDRQICLDAGADDYLAKPVRIEDLAARLRQAVPRGRPAEMPSSCGRSGNG